MFSLAHVILSIGLLTITSTQPLSNTRQKDVDLQIEPPSFVFNGINPEFYLQQRRPEPNIDRELKQAIPYARYFMQLYRNNLMDYPFSPNSAYPVELAPETVLHLQTLERFALKSGIIRIVAKSQHLEAFTFLKNILSAPNTDIRLRNTATRALASLQTSQTQTLLLHLLNSRQNHLRIRTAAAQALAYFKNPEVLAQFRQLLWSNVEPELTQAIIPALAHLGSGGALGERATYQEAAGLALAHFLINGHPNTDRIPPNLIAEALGRTAHPKSIELLKKALKSNNSLAQKKRLRKTLRHMELALKRR